MTGFLRFIGVVNASIWFGSAIFFTFVVGPSFFSPEMLKLFGGVDVPMAKAYSGAVTQILLERYYIVQEWCGAIALFHLLVEWMYTGKAVQRLTLWLLIGMFGLDLAGGYLLQPKMQELHYVMYGGRFAPAQRQRAAQAFSILHSVAQTANFLVTAGLLIYVWNVTNPSNAPRFTSRTKFRG